MASRREVLRGISGAVVISVAGCVGAGDGDSSSSSADSDEQQQEQEQRDESPSAEQHDEIPPVEVVINYWSDWSGHISTEDTGASVQGPGQTSATIDGYPETVSVVAQKEDDFVDPITAEIYVDGNLAAEQSSTAEYGVVRVSIRP